MGLSQRAYAKHRGVTENAVRKAVKAGRIQREPDGTIEPEAADAAWDANSSKSPNDGAPTVNGSSKGKKNGHADVSELTQVRIGKLKADVAKSELAVEQLRGELVDRAEARAAIFAFFRQVRESWQSWPARVASEMAMELQVEVETLRPILDRYVYEQLESIAADSDPEI